MVAVQHCSHGAVTLANSATSVTVTLTGDDVIVLANTILTWTYSDGTSGGGSNHVQGVITNTTTLTFTKATTGSRTLNIEWHLSEFDASVETQNISDSTITDGLASTAFTAVADVTNSYINPGNLTRDSSTWGDDDACRVEFEAGATPNQITYRVGDATVGPDTWAGQIVESSDFAVTSFNEVDFTEAGATKAVDITSAGLSATTDAFALWTYEQESTIGLDEAFLHGAITSSTQFTATRFSAANDFVTSITVFIVEPTDSTTIEHVAQVFGTTELTDTLTITAVDTDKAVLVGGGWQELCLAYTDVGSDNFIEVNTKIKFTTEGASITSISIERESQGGTATATTGFSVVEWDAGAVATQMPVFVGPIEDMGGVLVVAY